MGLFFKKLGISVLAVSAFSVDHVKAADLADQVDAFDENELFWGRFVQEINSFSFTSPPAPAPAETVPPPSSNSPTIAPTATVPPPSSNAPTLAPAVSEAPSSSNEPTAFSLAPSVNTNQADVDLNTDRDGDGVPDILDICPGQADEEGCVAASFDLKEQL